MSGLLGRPESGSRAGSLRGSERDGSERGASEREGSDRGDSERDGSDLGASERDGSDRGDSERDGSDRGDSERDGSDLGVSERDGSDRVGSERWDSERDGRSSLSGRDGLDGGSLRAHCEAPQSVAAVHCVAQAPRYVAVGARCGELQLWQAAHYAEERS